MLAVSTVLDLQSAFSTTIKTIYITTTIIKPLSICFPIYWPSTVTLQTGALPACPVLPKEFLEVLPAAWRPREHPIVSRQSGRHDIAFSLPAGIAFSIMNHAKAETEWRKQKAFLWTHFPNYNQKKRCIRNQQTQVRDRVIKIIGTEKEKNESLYNIVKIHLENSEEG